jgi:hypothetical protein
MKVFWSLNLVPTHWAPIFIRMCHNNPVCWFDWPLVPMLKGVTVRHFFDHSFHRTSNRIETTCIIGHFTHFVGCWKFTQHYKGEPTVRLVKDMSSITRTHSLLPKRLGSAELAVQSQQSHSMMAQAMKSPNVSETKHILIILIVLYNSQGKIGKIDGYLYIYIWYMIYDIWYLIYDMIYWWQKIWPKLSQRSNPERPWLELGIW